MKKFHNFFSFHSISTGVVASVPSQVLVLSIGVPLQDETALLRQLIGWLVKELRSLFLYSLFFFIQFQIANSAFLISRSLIRSPITVLTVHNPNAGEDCYNATAAARVTPVV